MFEKEIKYITDVSLNKLKKLGAFFTFEQIQSTELHPAITKYINAELDYLIFQDRKKLLQKSAFDYSDPEILKYFDLIGKEIKSRKKISFEDAKTLIIQAVSFTANFVVRPKWSLTKFVYNQDQLKPTDEIRYSLNYIYYYDFVRNVLLNYIEKKRSINLSLIDFEVALNKIDKEILSINKEKIIDNALYSIADFFGIGNKESNQVAPNFIELFLKEKDLVDYIFRLRRALPVEAKYQYEIKELRQILYTPGKSDKIDVLPSRGKNDKAVEAEVDLQGDLFVQQEDVSQKEPESVINSKELNKNKESETKSENQSKVKDDDKEFNPENNQVPIELENLNKQISDQEEITEDIEENSEEIIDEESIMNNSSDDDLLEVFDSQLKALEEESKLLLDEDDNEIELLKAEEPKEFVDEDLSDDEDEIQLDLNEENIKEENLIEDNDIFEEIQLELQQNEKVEINEYLQQEEKDESLRSKAPQRDKDIFSFLSDKEIDKIVSNVFNDDREDFVNTLEKVSECFFYEEATEILKSVFFSYRVNPYSKDAVALTNSVSNYFNQAN